MVGAETAPRTVAPICYALALRFYNYYPQPVLNPQLEHV
jgi:hypothetical protein